jgi:hypothetical protein
MWMWHGYGTTHFLVHFTHALSTKHDGIHIHATMSPIKKLLRLPLQSHHSTATLQHSSEATPIVSASIATAKTMRIGWLLCFLSICLLIFCY